VPQLKLTKTNIDRVAKPGAKGDVLYWDVEPKGFGLRVTPTGKATFIVQGVVVGGKEARVTIGPYGVFTVDQAREEAREHLRSMRKGIDPRKQRKEQEALTVTLAATLDAYLDRPGKLKESTKAEMRRHVEKVFTTWRDKPIAAITEDDVRKRHRELMEKGLTGKPAPASANAAMVTLRILMNFAGRQYRRADGSPLILRNPVEVLKDHWAKLGSRTDRYIDKRKIGEVWNKLWDARANPKNRDGLAAIDLTIFALLCGGRRDEMAALTWNRVNIDEEDPSNCWWHLPERKRGDPIWLPLSSQAVALLKLRPRKRHDDDEEESPFVFASWGKSGHIADARTPMELVSEIVGKHLSLHDMRRTFCNVAMRECLIEKFRTDLLTGHKPAQEDITARNYLDLARLDWLHPEIQRLGDWIDEQGRIAAAKASGANVVPIRA